MIGVDWGAGLGLDGGVQLVGQRWWPLVWLACLTPAAAGVDFNREVRPILSQHCFKCHGMDEQTRKGGLRLDERAVAMRPAKSGAVAIRPGDAVGSELVRRIRTGDADDVMPPPEAKLTLTEAQKETLERWVQEGAEYQVHWSLVAPRKGALPSPVAAGWGENPIDRWVGARMAAEGWRPSPEADRWVLVRRVSLDLIGLPPTLEEAEAFVNDREEGAYGRLVDRLLASPHYGERWARRWLDLARYADTNGYEKDRPRSMWPYRDWVIRALNEDMPFDQFTIRQLAGDLLPGATEADRVATGFHRNTMLNEEGGIDPLEYRFYAMVDRVNTTGTAWMGMTVGCAQCHAHKYDPLSQVEYYRLMGMLNGAEEPELEVRDAQVLGRLAEWERKVAALEAALPDKFKVEEVDWTIPGGALETASEARAERQEDGSWRVEGVSPERDTYTLGFEAAGEGFDRIRVEALADGGKGPGRTAHGNFVLSELRVEVATSAEPGDWREVRLERAEADVSQEGFMVGHAIDGKADTGWAVHVPGRTGGVGSHAAVFYFVSPLGVGAGARWRVVMEQQHGSQHTLGRLRVGLGRPVADSRPLEVRRAEARTRAWEKWLREEEGRAVVWRGVRPAEARSEQTRLRVLEDGSVYADGDVTKRDEYEVVVRGVPAGWTGLRLEAVPDDRLPRRGPGRVYFEGPVGDFFLSELRATWEGQAVKFGRGWQNYAKDASDAKAALDGDPQTGWSVDGAQGRTSVAMFAVAGAEGSGLAVEAGGEGELRLRLLFERYYPAPLGRFRLAVTTDRRVGEAGAWVPEVAEALAVSEGERTPAQREVLWREFLAQAPELAGARGELEALRRSRPALPTALVMAERPADFPRATRRHHRGEFLSPREEVEPGVPGFLPPLPEGAPRNRLGLARWLVAREHPLTARVVVNREWQAFFGRGLVRTMEDFGFQGELPTHPELLDWLAVELMDRGWSLKGLHRLIVTSATYRQSSVVTAELRERDPENRWLARGPRYRLEAEVIRDGALRAGGVLSGKVGGASVFPPQLASITTEGTYGPLEWKVSEGEDRYRRSLYTFAKRTAPFAMYQTFDAPAGEACVARREVSNTPLQALTLLNDGMFLEVAQALGRRMAGRGVSVAEGVREVFRRCVTRGPTVEEEAMLVAFWERARARWVGQESEAAKVAGAGEGEVVERAAWTALARVVMNLDETITQH